MLEILSKRLLFTLRLACTIFPKSNEYSGNLNIVELLLRTKKVDINAQNKFGETALHLAGEREYLEIVKLLLENGAHVDLGTTYLKYFPTLPI